MTDEDDFYTRISDDAGLRLVTEDGSTRELGQSPRTKGGPGSGDFGHGPQGGGLVGGAGEGTEGGKIDESGGKVYTNYAEARDAFQTYLNEHDDLRPAAEDWINGYEQTQRELREHEPELGWRVTDLMQLEKDAPKYEGEAWRGIDTLVGGKEYFKNLKVGDVITDDGFMATSTSEKFAQSFGAGGVVIQIENARGIAIDRTPTSEQKEVLLAPKTKLSVTREGEKKTIPSGKGGTITMQYVYAKMI